MARAQVRPQADRLVKRSVNESLRAFSGVARGFDGISPSQPTTEPVTDGDGNIHTLEWFLLGVHTLGDEYAQLRVKGRVIDYGN